MKKKANDIECGLCKNMIHTRKEKYVHIEDYEKEKKQKELWCHLTCFNKGMNRELSDIEKRSERLLSMAEGMMSSMGIVSPDKTFEIK